MLPLRAGREGGDSAPFAACLSAASAGATTASSAPSANTA